MDTANLSAGAFLSSLTFFLKLSGQHSNSEGSAPFFSVCFPVLYDLEMSVVLKCFWHILVHSPHEIISTVCDFPYKIIEKCFQ